MMFHARATFSWLVYLGILAALQGRGFDELLVMLFKLQAPA